MSDNTAAKKTKVKKYRAEKAEEVKVKITKKELKKQRELILITIPFIIYGFIFCYLPLVGWLMAFENYKPAKGYFGSEWVGFEQFRKLFQDRLFIGDVRNTLAMGVINLTTGFIMSILFAILLNEVRLNAPKKFVQTVSYLPHFLSWIIVTGIIRDMLSMNGGIVNDLLVRSGILSEPMNFFLKPNYFWWIVAFANLWKETGWGSIIYLSAITGINPELYEAAELDGAGRFAKMWHVTLPGIKSTIFILLLINMGNVLNAGFEIQYLLGNGVIQKVSETIDIYVLKWGIGQANYSMGTAAGIFKSVVALILIMISNAAAKAAGEERLF